MTSKIPIFIQKVNVRLALWHQHIVNGIRSGCSFLWRQLRGRFNQIWICVRLGSLAIILGLLLMSFLFAQSRKELGAEISILERTRDSLERDYWNLKQKNLRDRERITDNLATLDDTLKTLFERRNSLTEELFLVMGNLKSTQEIYDAKAEEAATFVALINEKVENEAKAISSGFPSELETNLLRVNQLRDQGAIVNVSDFMNAYLDFEKLLLARGEQIEVYETNILNTATGVSEQAQVIRVGFIQSAYATPEQSGFLIRVGGLTGTGYEWKEDLPATTQTQLVNNVREAYNNGNTRSSLTVLVDATQSGNRVRTFLEDNRKNTWVQFIEFFRSGGFMMYPLAILFVIALIISIERVVYFRRNRLKSLTYADEVITLCTQDRMAEAERLIKNRGGLVKDLFAPFFKHKRIERDEGERLLEERITGILPYLEKRLATLAVLGTIAPLLGLLGTVSGMIALFDVITLYGNNNPKVLAGGISIALVTTQTGLSLAVPIILLHHILTNYKTKLIDYLESIGLLALDIFAPVGEAVLEEERNAPEEKSVPDDLRSVAITPRKSQNPEPRTPATE